MTRFHTAGILIVEAVVAAFLMVFAFLASASLFDASLRWESQSGNTRMAALIAERKMEELRAQCSQVPSGSTFAAHADAILAGPHPPYTDAPGFTFTVQVLPNSHDEVPTSGETPDEGVHSPSSTVFTRPTNPSSTDRANPPYPLIDPPTSPFNDAGDFQKNGFYSTYPYSRAMPNSYRLVQVSVEYGTGDARQFDLVSLLSDPIPPPPLTFEVVRTAGSSTLSGTGSFAEYEIRVTAQSGAVVEEVSALWSIHPLSTGTVDVFALNAAGTKVRVRRNAFSRNGTTAVLYPQIRYHSVQGRAESEDISL